MKKKKALVVPSILNSGQSISVSLLINQTGSDQSAQRL